MVAEIQNHCDSAKPNVSSKSQAGGARQEPSLLKRSSEIKGSVMCKLLKKYVIKYCCKLDLRVV